MIQHLHCHECGKQVSTGFEPVPTDTPDKGIIIRAHIRCPECIEEEELGRRADKEEMDAKRDRR